MTEPQRRSRSLAGRAWVERVPPLHLLLAVVGALVLVGVVMVFSAAGRSVADGTAATVLVRHLIFPAAAAVTFLVGMWVAPARIRVWTPVLPLACPAALVPGIGEVGGGARRWISIGGLTVQPGEVAETVPLLWGAHVLALRGRAVRHGTHAVLRWYRSGC